MDDGNNKKAMKLGILKASGMGSYFRLKCESGVHKVIRVPETERSGRLHSSAISIAVLPEIPFVSITYPYPTLTKILGF
jgi:peptide chain release factor 1